MSCNVHGNKNANEVHNYSAKKDGRSRVHLRRWLHGSGKRRKREYAGRTGSRNKKAGTGR